MCHIAWNSRLKRLQNKFLLPTMVVVNSSGNLRTNVISSCLKSFSAILLFFLAADISFAQTAAPDASPSLTSLPSDEFLRGQLISLNSMHDSLISTVHWALGVAFGIAVLLVTYNWLVTGRNIARDKEALREELRGMFKTAEAQSHERLLEQMETYRAAMATNIEKATATALDAIDRKISHQQAQINSLREEMNSKFTQTGCEQLLNEARYWNVRDVPGNEFTTYRQLLDLASPDPALSPHVNTALKEILRLIQNPRTSYFTSEVAELTTSLDRLPSAYAAMVGAVKEALTKRIAVKPPM